MMTLLLALLSPLLLAPPTYGLTPDAVLPKVIELSPANFKEVMAKGKPVLINFYASWCGHCKAIAPVWKDLADLVPSSDVVIAKVDAGVHSALANDFEVTALPDIFLITKTPERYRGDHSLPALVAYLNKQLNLRLQPPPTLVGRAAGADYQRLILNPAQHVVAVFDVEGSPRGKTVRRLLEKVARAFAREEDVAFFAVDVMDLDKEVLEDLKLAVGATAFPALKVFPKGEKKVGVDYKAPYETGHVVAFINRVVGSKRTVSGDLDSTAGVVEELGIKGACRLESPETLKTAAVKASELKQEDSSLNAKILAKAAEKGCAWVERERTRLQKMIDSGEASGPKVDSFQKRVNVLRTLLA